MRTSYLIASIFFCIGNISASTLEVEKKDLDYEKKIELTSHSIVSASNGETHLFYGSDQLYHAAGFPSNWEIEIVDKGPSSGNTVSAMIDNSDALHLIYEDKSIANPDDFKFDRKGYFKYATNISGKWEIQHLPEYIYNYWNKISEVTVLLDLNNHVHLFFLATDQNSQKVIHVTNQTGFWTEEFIAECDNFFWQAERKEKVSALLDQSGNIYLLYFSSKSLHLLTNKFGDWREEHNIPTNSYFARFTAVMRTDSFDTLHIFYQDQNDLIHRYLQDGEWTVIKVDTVVPRYPSKDDWTPFAPPLTELDMRMHEKGIGYAIYWDAINNVMKEAHFDGGIWSIQEIPGEKCSPIIAPFQEGYISFINRKLNENHKIYGVWNSECIDFEEKALNKFGLHIAPFVDAKGKLFAFSQVLRDDYYPVLRILENDPSTGWSYQDKDVNLGASLQGMEVEIDENGITHLGLPDGMRYCTGKNGTFSSEHLLGVNSLDGHYESGHYFGGFSMSIHQDSPHFSFYNYGLPVNGHIDPEKGKLYWTHKTSSGWESELVDEGRNFSASKIRVLNDGTVLIAFIKNKLLFLAEKKVGSNWSVVELSPVLFNSWVHIDIDNKGFIHLLYDRSGRNKGVYYKSNVEGKWVDEMLEKGSNYFQATLSVDEDGVVHVAYLHRSPAFADWSYEELVKEERIFYSKKMNNVWKKIMVDENRHRDSYDGWTLYKSFRGHLFYHDNKRQTTKYAHISEHDTDRYKISF